MKQTRIHLKSNHHFPFFMWLKRFQFHWKSKALLFLISLLSACSFVPINLPYPTKTESPSKAIPNVIDVQIENNANSSNIQNIPLPNNSTSVESNKDILLTSPTAVPTVGHHNSEQQKLFICDDITPYVNKVVGNGECVDLLKACALVSHTPQWRQGAAVWGNKIPSGTAIATFENGVYPNRKGHHAAIYISQDEKGIYVWDQWRGKAVHTRLITPIAGKSPGNTAQHYRVIQRE